MGEPADQISIWRAVGSRLGIEVIAPWRVALSDGSRIDATALVKVGAGKGIVVDPAWATLEPHADRLGADGFGYSAVELEDGDDDDPGVVELLKDWGWSPHAR
ncbi:hypothetical protein [Phenylobacterium sp.]|uniref:hypothetical protein n=1 Tax=Phenylobacterium sp. TaxID=1871053 RepID=UPI0035648345